MKTGKFNNTEKINPHHQYPMGFFFELFIQGFTVPVYKRKEKKKKGKKPQPYQIFFSLHMLPESCMRFQLKRSCNAKTPEIHTAPGTGSGTRPSTDRGFFHTGSAMQLLFSYRAVTGWSLLPSQDVCQDWRFVLWTEQSLVWFPATI